MYVNSVGITLKTRRAISPVKAVTPHLPRNKTKSPTKFIAETRAKLLAKISNACLAAGQKLAPSIAEIHTVGFTDKGTTLLIDGMHRVL